MKLNPQLEKLTPEQRLLQYERPIIALTGGIATGKTTVSNMLKSSGIEVVCADLIIKEIYKDRSTIDFISHLVPEVVSDAINFSKLREIFFSVPNIKQQIESHLFSLYPSYLEKYFNQCQSQDFILYDIPLLFEKGYESQVDFTICVYAAKELQIERIQQRDGSSEQSAQRVISHQLSIDEKRDRSDYVISNDGELSALEKQVEKLLERLFKKTLK